MKTVKKRCPDIARIYDKITFPTGLIGCWLWSGGQTSKGYGKLSINNKTTAVHRYCYEQAKGPIPVGMLVRHSCDTPLCCNPSHLLLGTPAQNMDDKVQRGRQSKGKTLALRKTNKLTPGIVNRIRDDLDKGIKPIVLACKYKVSRAHINSIGTGRRWGHV